MQTGSVIALDGPDGVGKTTQLELLKNHLEQQGKTVHITRASGGTPIGEDLRKVSKSHHLRPAETDVFISLAMFSALAQDLQERETHGQIVLIDRSPLAMVAYNAYGSTLPDESTDNLRPSKRFVLEVCKDTCKAWGIDLLLFLDAPQETLDARRQERKEHIDYFESQNDDYHQRVREGYRAGLRYLKANSDLTVPVVTIDASPDMHTINRTIIQTIGEHMPNSSP